MSHVSALSGPQFLKGHGTENDFVVLVDVDVAVRLTPANIQALADRRAGIGGDGILRIAKAADLVATGELEALPADVSETDWFMDYRNADGSVAEMCGNGVRVFAHALVATGLASEGTIRIGTRAGLRPATVSEVDGNAATVSVDMGVPEVLGVSNVLFNEHRFAGLAIDVGNPHVAAIVPGLSESDLSALPIEQQPDFDTEFFPHGVNVEIATEMRDGQVHMRVHERGAGETRSCGTGIVATAMAALADAGEHDGRVEVHVPGGTVTVEFTDGRARMTGPSRLVGGGALAPELLAP